MSVSVVEINISSFNAQIPTQMFISFSNHKMVVCKISTGRKTICRQMFHVRIEAEATKTIARYRIDGGEVEEENTVCV